MTALLQPPSATLAASLIRTRQLSVKELWQKCQRRIRLREPQVKAWTYLAWELSEEQAAGWDRQLAVQASWPLGRHRLLGIPVGVKDIFATVDMPTTWGLSCYCDRNSTQDATIVSSLKQAGAIILGKTVTTELATAAPGPTTNPHRLSHTPGGSSSGSAAAVADGMVPVAIGTQTMGSVLRPAAYCGVFGLKPSFGALSRHGVMPVSRWLDHVGIFGRCLDDIGLLLGTLAKPDPRDRDCIQSLTPAPSPPAPGALRLGFVPTPHWDRAEAIVHQRLGTAVNTLKQAGCMVEPVTLPPIFKDYWEVVKTLCAQGLYANHRELLERYPNHISPLLEDWLRQGQTVDESVYRQAVAYRQTCQQRLQQIFSRYDALVSPVTLDSAPQGIDQTGSPIFCSLWTLCGVPALNLPLGQTAQGLPLGCQLVGAHSRDWQLLAVAARCWPALAQRFGEIKIPVVNGDLSR